MSIVSAAVALSSFLVFFVSATWDVEHMSIADVSDKCTAFRICAYIFARYLLMDALFEALLQLQIHSLRNALSYLVVAMPSMKVTKSAMKAKAKKTAMKVKANKTPTKAHASSDKKKSAAEEIRYAIVCTRMRYGAAACNSKCYLVYTQELHFFCGR